MLRSLSRFKLAPIDPLTVPYQFGWVFVFHWIDSKGFDGLVEAQAFSGLNASLW